MPNSDEVFISYSHDAPSHVDAVLDQYEASPPEGWPRWMDRKIRESKFVIMVCTETYRKRVMGDEIPGHGHGVRWEGNLIYQHLYDAGTLNTRFIPVILHAADRQNVPEPVRGATIYALDSAKDYEAMCSRLDGIAPHKPPLGARPRLPARPVKTNPKLYITSPIDIDLWDRAQWMAVVYGDKGDSPPLLGLAFNDREVAKAIFRGWHERYGDRDEHEELRVSIIEGDIPGREAGYSVNISTDLDVFIERLRAAGYEYDDDLLWSISRINRMHPAPGSVNLETFKRNVKRNKTYVLVPVVYRSETDVEIIPGLGILKNKVLFRRVEDVNENDPDIAVMAREQDG